MSIRTRRKPMRAVAAAVAAAVGASLLAISGPTNVGAAPTVTEQTRIAGADRYATANAVALAAVGTRTDVTAVVIASGENFPDGLAASALAGALNAPMLLTQASALPTSVLATLTTIRGTNTNLRNAVLIGGTSVISADIATQLTAVGLTVTRIAGDTRYATANAVAAEVKRNNTGQVIGSFGGYRTAFLANGNNFPDALAASSWAYRNKHPLFLTNGTSLDADTIAAITAAGVQQIIILGGESAVSAEAATAAAGISGVITTTRVSGDTRYDTATALATTLATVDADYKTRAMLVSGTNFPDALAAAQLAGMADSYALIPVTSPLPTAVSTWITANQSTLTTIRAIGGTEAIPADIVTEVKTGATTAPITATIAALDGATTATVTFSSAVASVAPASFNVTSALGANKALTTATLNTAKTVATLTLTTGVFQPGDVIQVVANAIASSTDANLKVATTTFTVAANTAAPVATLVAYAGATYAAAALPKVWVSFDVETTGFNCATHLRHTAQTIGSSATAYFASTTTTHVTGKVFSCVVDTGKAVMVAGDTVTLLANAASSSASTPVGSAVTTTTVVTDATAPSISSARFAQSGTATGAVPATRGLALAAGNITVSAKAGSSLGGKAGNAVTFGLVVGPEFASAEACVYTPASLTVTISAATTSSAFAVQAACALSSSAKDLITVAATAGELTGLGSTRSVGLLQGGADLLTITITTSEPLNPASVLAADIASRFTFGGGLSATITGYGTSTTASTQAAEAIAGVIVVTATTAGTALAGVSTIAATASVTDRNSNAAGTTAVAMTAA